MYFRDLTGCTFETLKFVTLFAPDLPEFKVNKTKPSINSPERETEIEGER